MAIQFDAFSGRLADHRCHAGSGGGSSSVPERSHHISPDHWRDPPVLVDCRDFCNAVCVCGPVHSHSFKGIAFEDDAALASSLFYLSFVTLSSTGYGDIVPLHPLARSLCNFESVIGQLYPATVLARLVTLALRADTT